MAKHTKITDVKAATNICILATGKSISAGEFALLAGFFNDAKFTLIAPKFDGEDFDRMDLWTDGARSGFARVMAISRRMSWSSFDLVINWEQGGLEKALCFMLLPKPKIITKQGFLAENT